MDANFAALVDYLNTNVILKDGTKNFTALPALIPKGIIGTPVKDTAGQGFITNSATDTTLTKTFTAASSRQYKYSVTIHPFVSDSISPIIARIIEGSTQLAEGFVYPAALDQQNTLTFFATSSPSAGSKTVKVQLGRASGTGTVGHAASSTSPATLIVEDLGPA